MDDTFLIEKKDAAYILFKQGILTEDEWLNLKSNRLRYVEYNLIDFAGEEVLFHLDDFRISVYKYFNEPNTRYVSIFDTNTIYYKKVIPILSRRI